MGKFSRDKGKRFEQWVASKLRALGIACHRGWQARSGSDDADVVVDALPDVHIECKTGACPNIWKAMEQARKAAKPGTRPTVVAHRDHGPTVVVVDFCDWLEELREKSSEVIP